MIDGRVSDLRLPQIPISLLDGNGIWQTLEAVIDTGFTGQLALPGHYIERFGLELNDEIPVMPATGQTILVPAGNVRLVWRGRRMLAHAVQSGTHPLLGMRLLWNNHIAIDAVAGGAVAITPLGEQR